jgi:hypothetical protein
MSAFANPESTQVVDLDTCYCPNNNHDHDTVTIRTDFGYGDIMTLGRVHTDAGRIDPMAERAKLLELAIVSWSFVGDEGEPVPLGLPMILLLKPSIVEPLAEAIDDAWQAATVPVPNGSSGRSRPSSLATLPASTNRAGRRAAKRSTPRSSSSPAGPTTT